jgi:glutathione S-transferase
MPDTVLWHIEVSHYNEKARWALDVKQVPHVRRAPLPGLHGLYALALTRGATRRLPILDLDGRRIADSTAIIAALEASRPEPPLYPADPGERERALALEDFFDETLAPAVRSFAWFHTLPDADASVAAVMTGAGAVPRRAMRATAPLFRPLVRRDYGADAAGAARARERILAAMDRIVAEVGPRGHLVGDSFGVADLTAAALFTPLLAPPERPYAPPLRAPAVLELRRELEARPGGAWVAEMYARHRGTSAEVAA